jgi:hypothetical protein
VEKRSRLKRLLSVYDAPIHRDWLFWLVLAATGVVAVRSDDPWNLLSAALSFVVLGWILGAPRNFIRGYRDGHGAVDDRQRS